MAKQSRIKRLYSKKLAKRVAAARGAQRTELRASMQRETDDTIRKMRAKGWKLATELDTGEGVFVREHDVVGLHVQLPSSLYKRLDAECRQRDLSKREVVTKAIELYLGGARP